MEHRWHQRGEVDFNVVIYSDGLPVACGRAHNLSASGLLVQPGATLIDINAPVELECAVKGRQGAQRVRIPAQVVHQSEQGTGVMFQTQRPDVQRSLNTMLMTFLPPPVTRARIG